MSRELKCSACEHTCDRTFFVEQFYEVKICSCGNLFCGDCARSQKCACSPLARRQEYPLLSKLCTFANTAPADQLDRIDMQLSRPANCPGCGTEQSELYRCQIQQVMCKQCIVDKHFWASASYNIFLWSTTSKCEDIFIQIIGHTMPKAQLQKAGSCGTLPIRITKVLCAVCVDIPSRLYIWNGEPSCYHCHEGFPYRDCCSCLIKFIECIECIPENQLHLLTYSKWVKAVGCVRHEHILNELSAVSSDGLRKGKLRSFFKDGEFANERLVNVRRKQLNVPVLVMNSTVTTSTSESDIKKLSWKLSTVDTSTPLAPNRILCLCGRWEDLSNVFVCNTCSVCGVCSLCIIRKHSGHEYQDAVKTMVTISCVNTQSELTLRKLSEWSGEAKELNQESEKAFEKLCTTLGTSFVEVINCDDHQRIQTVLEKTDTSTLEKRFKDTVNSTRKLHKAIEYFCEDLTEAVEKDKGNITSVHETSDFDRK